MTSSPGVLGVQLAGWLVGEVGWVGREDQAQAHTQTVCFLFFVLSDVRRLVLLLYDVGVPAHLNAPFVRIERMLLSVGAFGSMMGF